MTKTDKAERTIAGDMMRTEVFTVASTTPLRDLGRLLSDYGISGAPVTDEAGHIVGVVSMRDLIDRYAESPGTNPRDVHDFYESGVDEEEVTATIAVPDNSEDTVADVMTAQVYTIVKGASIREVARRMVELRVHRILVEEAGNHVGLITTFDVLKAIAAGKS